MGRNTGELIKRQLTAIKLYLLAFKLHHVANYDYLFHTMEVTRPESVLSWILREEKHMPSFKAIGKYLDANSDKQTMQAILSDLDVDLTMEEIEKVIESAKDPPGDYLDVTAAAEGDLKELLHEVYIDPQYAYRYCILLDHTAVPYNFIYRSVTNMSEPSVFPEDLLYTTSNGQYLYQKMSDGRINPAALLNQQTLPILATEQLDHYVAIPNSHELIQSPKLTFSDINHSLQYDSFYNISLPIYDNFVSKPHEFSPCETYYYQIKPPVLTTAFYVNKTPHEAIKYDPIKQRIMAEACRRTNHRSYSAYSTTIGDGLYALFIKKPNVVDKIDIGDPNILKHLYDKMVFADAFPATMDAMDLKSNKRFLNLPVTSHDWKVELTYVTKNSNELKKYFIALILHPLIYRDSLYNARIVDVYDKEDLPPQINLGHKEPPKRPEKIAEIDAFFECVHRISNGKEVSTNLLSHIESDDLRQAMLRMSKRKKLEGEYTFEGFNSQEYMYTLMRILDTHPDSINYYRIRRKNGKKKAI